MNVKSAARDTTMGITRIMNIRSINMKSLRMRVLPS